MSLSSVSSGQREGRRRSVPNTHFILRSEDVFPVVTTSKGCLMFETRFLGL